MLQSFFVDALEAPASRAVRLGGAQGKHGLRREFVDIPRRWPGAWSAVVGGERGSALVNRGWPAIRPECLGDTRDRGRIGYFDGIAFQDEVEVVRGDGEDTVRAVRKVLRFAG